MMRRILQICLVLGGLLMFFRFGGPALFFGATGPGPFGNRWVDGSRTPTLLLDADMRFFGAIMIGIGILFFWAVSRMEALRSVIFILACAVAVGGAARIYARITYGNPGTAGMIPIVLEVGLPIVMILALRHVAKDSGNVGK